MRTIQVRNVPDEVHRELRTRAAAAGVWLSDLALAELERVARVRRSPTYCAGLAHGRWGERRRDRRGGSLPTSRRADRAWELRHDQSAYDAM